MAIEGGGELDRLYEQLKNAQDRHQESERLRADLGDKFRAEQQAKEDAVRAHEDTKQQLAGARQELSEARRVASLLPGVQQDLVEARAHNRDLREIERNHAEDLEKARADVQALSEELGNVKSALAEAQAEAAESAKIVAAARLIAQGITDLG